MRLEPRHRPEHTGHNDRIGITGPAHTSELTAHHRQTDGHGDTRISPMRLEPRHQPEHTGTPHPVRTSRPGHSLTHTAHHRQTDHPRDTRISR